MPSLKLLAAVLTALVISLAGCSDDEPSGEPDTSDASDTTSAAPDPDVLSGDVVEQLVQALTGDDAARLAQALELTEPGSVAHDYTGYQLAFTNARIDAGMAGQGTGFDAPTPAEFGGWQVCPPGATGDECVTFAAFEGSDGRVSSFTINGADLSSRLAAGDGRAKRLGRGIGSIEMLYAYKSVSSNQLVVVAKVTSETQSLELGSANSATYEDPTGERLNASSALVPRHLGPGSTATILMSFPEPAKLGGAVRVDVYDEDADPHGVTLSTR